MQRRYPASVQHLPLDKNIPANVKLLLAPRAIAFGDILNSKHMLLKHSMKYLLLFARVSVDPCTQTGIPRVVAGIADPGCRVLAPGWWKFEEAPGRLAAGQA